jgi:hypothetical protein
VYPLVVVLLLLLLKLCRYMALLPTLSRLQTTKQLQGHERHAQQMLPAT